MLSLKRPSGSEYPGHSRLVKGMIDIHKMSVLIADDTPNMITTVRSMMRVLKYGRYFVSAANGAEAWRMLTREDKTSEPIDLAILDYNMPFLNGGEVLNRIREDRNLRDLPVLMVTAQANSDFVASAAESEIDAYVLKPVTVKILGDKIRSVVYSANNPPPMVLHLKEARRLEDVGDLDGAIQEALLASDVNPSSSRPLREIGYFYYRKDDFKEAKRWLLKAAKMNSLDVVAFHYLGEIFAKANDIEMASRYFEKAMSINPRHVSRAVSFGMTLLEKDEAEEAVLVFEKALSLSDKNFELNEKIALSCVHKGAKEFGASLLESIIKAQPKRNDLVFLLGKTYGELGQHAEALSYLTRAEQADKENFDIKMRLADEYIAIGKPIRAEKSLKEILKQEPDNEEAMALLKKCV